MAAFAVGCACWLAWASLRVGAARFVAEHALRTRAVGEAEAATGLAPSDADAHFARAWLLAQAGDSAGALRSYERALALRPRDHVLWLEAGKERERAGDVEGALASLREAVRLAPAYAQPRWQLGNALLRAGRFEEAHAELRRAAESDPTLYPNFIEAEWHASGGDPNTFIDNAGARTHEETAAVVRLLIREREARAGLDALHRSSVRLTPEEQRALVADLVAAGEFAGAYEVWSEGRGAAGTLTDGGFEEGARSDEEGFGWRFARAVRNVQLSLDAEAPREGARSLKVEYAGASEPSAPAVSRLVAVEPGARYRLAFAARARELVTGGPPYVEVVSAASSGEVLGAAAPRLPSTDGWQELAIEFTAPQSAAVRVALKRWPCHLALCPAFGALWLDAFELRRL